MTRGPEELIAPEIRFIGEQDGIAERELKNRLVSYFRAAAIECRAYLVQVEYGMAGSFHVALCVRLESGDEGSVIARVGEIFREMFSTSEHLDVILLTEEQEKELGGVASAFFA